MATIQSKIGVNNSNECAKLKYPMIDRYGLFPRILTVKTPSEALPLSSFSLRLHYMGLQININIFYIYAETHCFNYLQTNLLNRVKTTRRLATLCS